MNVLAGIAVGVGSVGACWIIAWCVVRLAEINRPDLADYSTDERAEGDWPYIPEVFRPHSD